MRVDNFKGNFKDHTQDNYVNHFLLFICLQAFNDFYWAHNHYPFGLHPFFAPPLNQNNTHNLFYLLIAIAEARCLSNKHDAQNVPIFTDVKCNGL